MTETELTPSQIADRTFVIMTGIFVGFVAAVVLFLF
jgi:hypothetical protein